MQLVAYGAQDVYLTGNPQITFFKVVYRRHTNFAAESIEQTFNGAVGFGSKLVATISRNGDLITNCWIQAKITPADGSGSTFVNCLGHKLIKTVELEIGGQKIDKHYGEWLEIWSELTLPEEKLAGYKAMVHKYDTGTSITASTEPVDLYIPLIFFFNRNPGLALPLIALQYHEVKISVETTPAAELVQTNSNLPKSLSASLWVDYIYLDTDERRRFAQVSHELLIEQVQEMKESVTAASTSRVRLTMNHPIKELIWVFRDSTVMATGAADPYDFSDVDSSGNSGHLMDKAKLQLNGHDRFAQREASYFHLVQPYQHHTRIPKRPIYVYSFALKPEEHQPSGTCNFSRIDNASLNLEMLGSSNDSIQVQVFAVNYNVLRIMSGMGGLAYSN